MTETEWLTTCDPDLMLDHVRDSTSERKLRLFAIACCRSFWHLLSDEVSRQAVEVAERYVDRLAPHEERDAACRAAWSAISLQSPERWKRAAALAAGRVVDSDWPLFGRWYGSSKFGKEHAWNAVMEIQNYPRRPERCHLIREIFGNPFRSVGIDKGCLQWNDGTVPRIAQWIYDERSFDDLPILADALEESGCRQAQLLAHCRAPGSHVRGCWALDLVLGKE
ncbi:MAG: hypothetical protein AB7K24_19515 [Gemmataceae bacterium]